MPRFPHPLLMHVLGVQGETERYGYECSPCCSPSVTGSQNAPLAGHKLAPEEAEARVHSSWQFGCFQNTTFQEMGATARPMTAPCGTD